MFPEMIINLDVVLKFSRAAERRYNRVKRWLRDVNLFSKDYLVVPINQNAHWYIVIIQNHNSVLTEEDLISDDDDISFSKHSNSKDETKYISFFLFSR